MYLDKVRSRGTSTDCLPVCMRVSRLLLGIGGALVVMLLVGCSAIASGNSISGDDNKPLAVTTEGDTDCTATTATGCGLDLTTSTEFAGVVDGTGDGTGDDTDDPSDWIEVTLEKGTTYRITVTPKTDGTTETMTILTAADTPGRPR